MLYAGKAELLKAATYIWQWPPTIPMRLRACAKE